MERVLSVGGSSHQKGGCVNRFRRAIGGIGLWGQASSGNGSSLRVQQKEDKIRSAWESGSHHDYKGLALTTWPASESRLVQVSFGTRHSGSLRRRSQKRQTVRGTQDQKFYSRSGLSVKSRRGKRLRSRRQQKGSRCREPVEGKKKEKERQACDGNTKGWPQREMRFTIHTPLTPRKGEKEEALQGDDLE